jgi:hypothetical protein
MKSKIYLPALFLFFIVSSGSLFVNAPFKSKDLDHTLQIDSAPFQAVSNLSAICKWDKNTSSVVVSDVKMGVMIPGKLPSGLPPVLQFYIFLSSQIQRWIWEIQPRVEVI